MNASKALEIVEEMHSCHNDWSTDVQAGYENHVYIVVTVGDLSFVVRSLQFNKLKVCGIYGDLSRYIRNGDVPPAIYLSTEDHPAKIVLACEGFLGDLSAYVDLLKMRRESVKSDFATRERIAKRLEAPGVQITGATDVWYESNRFQVSGEIHNNGRLSLYILCDEDSATAIFEALKGVK